MAILRSNTGWTCEVLNLSDLMRALKNGPSNINGEDGIDWTDLPTFGGEAPSNTAGIWSWDEDNLLVGDGVGDLEIVPRADAE